MFSVPAFSSGIPALTPGTSVLAHTATPALSGLAVSSSPRVKQHRLPSLSSLLAFHQMPPREIPAVELMLRPSLPPPVPEHGSGK